MYKSNILIILLLAINFNGYSQKNIKAVIETSLGNIYLELYAENAPETVANFVAYASKGLYSNTTFFRVCTPENEAERDIKIEVIQGGNVEKRELLPPITLETTKKTEIKHQNGTISMARSTPNSAQSSFFICIHNQPELDYGGSRNPDKQGFAAFGKVTKGMDIVLKIQQSANENQYILDPIVINSVKIIS